ncbi:MAG: CAP domain-containing protein, partial [Dehalococcoidia bacterium]|nr:CAP domain-containing protein [Dehalococcoidia bacterium]
MTISSGKAIPSWRPVVLGLLLVAALLLSLATSPSGVAGLQLGQDEQAVLDLINAHRADNGLAPLSVSPTLTDAALWMSRDMAENDYFSHTDSLGRDPFQRMADFGYNFNAWKGENLVAGSDTPQMSFELWRDSPGHNANMLNPNFVVVGLAQAYDPSPEDSYHWYWAAEFGGYDDGGTAPPTSTPEPSPTSPPEPTLA